MSLGRRGDSSSSVGLGGMEPTGITLNPGVRVSAWIMVSMSSVSPTR